MVDKNYKHIRGRFEKEEIYKPIKGGPGQGQKFIPSRSPSGHGAFLINQIESLSAVYSSDPEKFEDANRFFITVRAEDNSELQINSLEDKKSDVEVVKIIPEKNEAIIDSPNLELAYLKKKVEKYSQGATDSNRAKNEDLIAPIKEFSHRNEEDVISTDLLSENDATKKLWIEIECRGGKIKSSDKNTLTISQMNSLKTKFNLTCLEYFIATERIFFFTRMSLNEIKKAIKITDCIIYVDRARDIIRNWLSLEYSKISNEQIQNMKIISPNPNSAVVAILDSGLAEKHPLLKDSVLNCCSVIAEDQTTGDVDGHGTEMAGICIFDNLAKTIDIGQFSSPNFIESAKVYHPSTSNDENRHFWASLTQDAVQNLNNKLDKNRVFVMAITAPLLGDKTNTRWSQALDQIIYNDGIDTNLFCVSIGNVNEGSYNFRNYPDENIQNHNIQDPAQSINALTIGAYTELADIPRQDYQNFQVLAPKGGLSPYSSTNNLEHCIKPEVVFEGGNKLYDQHMSSNDDLLSLVTTSKDFTQGKSLNSFNATSCATSLAGNFAAKVWNIYPEARPESIRGLIVHSASWTDKLKEQFNPNNNAEGKNKLLSACGYGVPDIDYAMNSTPKRATIIIEDEIVNKNSSGDRQIKIFKLPIPEDVMTTDLNAKANLKVTLSYFAEPNEPEREKRNKYRGLDLEWDFQGPTENDDIFNIRINDVFRKKFNEGKDEEDKFKSSDSSQFTWKIGKQRRNRGTVQSDELESLVSLSEIVGAKGVAVYPRLGWWDNKRDFENKSMKFSLIITVEVFSEKDIDIYTPIKNAVDIPIEQKVENVIRL